MTTGRIRGQPPPHDHFRGLDLGHGLLHQGYDWLQPCETALRMKEKEGPLHRSRKPVVQLRPTYNTQTLPREVLEWQRQRDRRPIAKVKPKGHKPKPYTTEIWPAGSQGPRWRPLSPGEKAHRNNTAAAVQALSSKPFARSASCPHVVIRSRRVSKTPLVEPTPGVEAWDSVSQAPSSPRSLPSVHHKHLADRRSLGAFEVMSAETATATEAPFEFQGEDDHHIAAHLALNRRGWYDHRFGRFLG